MVKVEVIRNFKIKDYDKIYNIKRIDSKQPYNRLIEGDIFECDIEMCKYLRGETPVDPEKVIKIIELIPDNLTK